MRGALIAFIICHLKLIFNCFQYVFSQKHFIISFDAICCDSISKLFRFRISVAN